MFDKILVLAGPTGVGKSNLSIKLAKRMNGEIISADSMQIYKYMTIGTGKILPNEMNGITHYLLDVCEPDVEFSVSIYLKLAKESIINIISKGKLPIIVGGTGLYIRSLLYDQNQCNSGEDKKYRDSLYKLAEKQGNNYVHNMLKLIDYESYLNIHANNLKRVIRALEVYYLTKKPFSSFKNDVNPIYDFKYYVLNMNRDKLYFQINHRVDKMIEQGLVDEVLSLKQKGYNKNLQSMQGIGYKEIFDYLDGVLSLDEAIEKIKQNSRNYAKRQLTWFKKEKNHKFISKDEFNDSDILNFIVKDFNL